jgi:predicted phage terminase large subunit-like protein
MIMSPMCLVCLPRCALRVPSINTGSVRAGALIACARKTAIRGARLDATRPDFIILDDLDDEADTPLTIEKKINALTRKILPSGASSLVVLGVQNLPNQDGIFARLVDGRAEFLLDRIISGPYPAILAVEGVEFWERIFNEHGLPSLRIVEGEPSWEGQSLADCEALLTKIGITSFLVECQHHRTVPGGQIFQRQWFLKVVDDWPREATRVRFWDLAATEAKPGRDPDWTAGALVAGYKGQYTLCDMRRIRGTPRIVDDFIAHTAQQDGREVEVYIEQEPGSSGVNTIDHYQRRVLPGFAVYGVRSTGPKATRAKPAASAAEAGNYALLAGHWHADFFLECDGVTGHDDQIDAVSGAHTALHKPALIAGIWGR